MTTSHRQREPRTREQALLSALADGEPFDLSADTEQLNDPRQGSTWSSEREIDARLVYELCTDRSVPGRVHARGVQIIGARVVGDLDFRATTLYVPLLLDRCFVAGDCILEQATAPQIALPGCCLRSIRAQDFNTPAGLDLRGAHVTRGVLLRGASIGGFLSFDDAQFGSDAAELVADVGLDAHGIRIGQDASLRKATVRGMNFELADIGGDFDVSHARLMPADEGAPRAKALRARGCKVAGDVILDGLEADSQVCFASADVRGAFRGLGAHVRAGRPDESAADEYSARAVALNAQGIKVGAHIALKEGFEAEGEVNLLAAHLGLGLECTRAKFLNLGKLALNAQGVTTGGNVLLREDLVVNGELVLLGATIDGTLDLDNAEFANPGGVSIRAQTLRVAGNALLHDGCIARGEVNLDGAQIGGDLDCRGATFDNRMGTSFTIEGARVAGTFYWGPFREQGTTRYDDDEWRRWADDQPTGVVDFSRARVSRLVDHWTVWAYYPNLRLEGFVYDDLGGTAGTDVRLDFLKARAWQLSSQPFQQLAGVYERTGDMEAAREVRIEKERSLRRSGGLKRTARLANLVLDWTIRYGWEPWRAVVFGLAVVLVGGLLFASAGQESFTSADASPTGAPFQPMVFSLDTFLPIIDLRQQATWVPRETVEWHPFGWQTSGWVLHGLIWTELIVGWIISTLGVVAFTGLVRKT
jgi:hypothetical protein